MRLSDNVLVNNLNSNVMKKSIILAISCILFGAVTAMAQPQKVISKDFERFSTVKVQDKFVVKLTNSSKYAVRIICDERIAAHVQAYEKNGTLHLVLDEKGYTKELKKELKQKGAAQPVLEAEIYMPEIKSLILMDKVLVTNSDEIKSDNFTMTVTDDVKVQQLKINCTTADMDISKSAEVSGAEFIVSEKMLLKASNSSKSNIALNANKVSFDLNGSAVVDAKASCSLMQITASTGAESHINGTAEAIMVEASGLTRTDVEYLEAQNGKVTLTGSAKCHVNVVDKLTVNLTGSSMLTFKGMPSFGIERILGSTLIKADDPKRK